jgi:hypothetical protein
MRLTTLLLALVCLSTAAVATEETSPPEEAASGTRVVSRTSVDGTAPEGTPANPLPFKAEHPGDTALSQDEDGNWRFRSFPALATLYVNDKDTPGKSNCGAPCSSAWAPFLASSTENDRIGDWSLISVPGGRHQWAYKGHPVYLRYHDLPAHKGNIQREGFRKLEP